MIHSVASNTPGAVLPLAVNLIGMHHLQEPVQRLADFPYYQWFFTEKGKGELILQGKRYRITQNHGFLLFPNEEHTYRGLTEDWTVHFVGFSGANCGEILKALAMGEQGVYRFSAPDVFPEHLRRMEQASRSGDAKLLSSACYTFLLALSDCIRLQPQAELASQNGAIRKTVTYLEQHYKNAQFSLDDLAEAVGLSKSYLCHLFKQEMGQSIVAYLLSLKMGRAKFMLLHEPGKKIQDVAKECGFESPSYFAKKFREHTGQTPEQFRKEG